MDFEVVADGLQFVEAPRLDADGSLYFADLTGGGLYRRSPRGRIERFLPDRHWIGGIVLNEDRTVICSGKGGLIRFDKVTGTVHPLLAVIDGEPIIAVNDIEADDQGGLYGGTVDFAAIFERGEPPGPGVLFHLAPSGELTIIREGVAVSNGIDFSPSRTTLYHSESTAGIWAYGLGQDGVPRNPVLFAKLEDSDGLVVDSEGGVWVARWQAAEIVRYQPDATIDRRIHLPFPHLVSLTFGGDDLCDLYVTTGGSLEPGQPRQGAVVRVRSDVPGQVPARARLNLACDREGGGVN